MTMFDGYRHQKFERHIGFVPQASPFGFDAYARAFHSLPACRRRQMPRASETPRPNAPRRVTATHIPWRR